MIRHAMSVYNVKDMAFRDKMAEKFGHYPGNDADSRLKWKEAIAEKFTELDDMVDALLEEPTGSQQAKD